MCGISATDFRPAVTARRRASASPRCLDGATTFEHQPTPAYLRERAEFYRQRAMGVSNPTKAAEYRYIADVLDREADAFEKNNNNKQQRASD